MANLSMAPVKVSTDVKIVAAVLSVCVFLAAATVVIVAFIWRPNPRRSGANGGEVTDTEEVEETRARSGSLAVESRVIEERAINRDGSNLPPSNMIPKYE